MWSGVQCSDVEWTDVIYVKWFCFEVKWVTVKFLGAKVPSTLGWLFCLSHFFDILLVLFCIIVYMVVCFVCFCLILQIMYSYYVMHLYYYVMCYFVSLGILIVMYVLFCVFYLVLFGIFFVCKCVPYYCHRVSTQLQLNISYNMSSSNRKLPLNVTEGQFSHLQY
jgi:hypothetical protein